MLRDESPGAANGEDGALVGVAGGVGPGAQLLLVLLLQDEAVDGALGRPPSLWSMKEADGVEGLAKAGAGRWTSEWTPLPLGWRQRVHRDYNNVQNCVFPACELAQRFYGFFSPRQLNHDVARWLRLTSRL